MKYLAYLILFVSSIVYAQTASWYGGSFHGKRTANGEVFNQNALTAASNSHRMGTNLLVTNVTNGKSVKVKVNDTGGFRKYGRTLDLSKGAFMKIANPNQGVIKIKIQKL